MTTTQARGVTLEILPDEDAGNPFEEWDQLGSLVFFGRERHLTSREVRGLWNDPQDFLREQRSAIVLPVYKYEHGGVMYRTSPFYDPWDSGQVGYIFVTLEKVRSEWSCARVSRKLRDQVRETLRAEVETFSAWANGNVYGYVLTDEQGDVIDSCWGFYGADPQTNGIKDALPAEYRHLLND